jgi:hypothetical protein
MVSNTMIAAVCRKVFFRGKGQWHSILERGGSRRAKMWLTLGPEGLQLERCILATTHSRQRLGLCLQRSDARTWYGKDPASMNVLAIFVLGPVKTGARRLDQLALGLIGY